MVEINELAEKKYAGRIRKLRRCNKDEEEKEKFSEKLGTSYEIFFPNKNPEELNDSLIVWTSPDGKIIDAEYSYEIPNEEQYASLQVPEKDFKVIVEFFKDFKFQL